MSETGTSHLGSLPLLDVFSPQYRSDPIGTIRALGPGHVAARSQRGVEWLTYEHSAALMRDERFPVGFEELLTVCGFKPEDPAYRFYAKNTAALEGDAHRRQRRLLAPLFSPSTIERSRTVVRKIVSDRLDEVSDREFDFAVQVAPHVPAGFFCFLIGAPMSDSAFVAASSDSILKAFRADPSYRDEIAGAVDRLILYINEHIRRKQTDLSDDVLSSLLQAERKGETTIEEITEILFTLLTASSDNTSASLSQAILAFSQHEDQWDRLRGDHGLLDRAVMECARLRPNVWSDPRYAREDAVFCGLEIPSGTWMFASVVAGNQDPAVFQSPADLNIARPQPKPILNFGSGRHACLGRAVALVEMEETLRVLCERFKRVDVVGDPVCDGYPHGEFVRSLPVRISPA